MRVLGGAILFILVGCADQPATGPDARPTLPVSGFVYPIVPYEIVGHFGKQNVWYDNKYHTAQDVRGDAGTPVHAISDGVISYSGPRAGYGCLSDELLLGSPQ